MILATIIGNNANLPYGFVKSLLKCKEYEHIFGVGLYVPDNRNNVWKELKQRNDDVLLIDSDMVFTKDDVERVKEHLKDKDIVTGLYVMGMENYPPAIFKKEGGVYKSATPEEKLFEVDACGAGFLGISRKVVKELEVPFTQFINPLSGNLFGEDMAFCIKAQGAGFKILCDPTIKLGHIKTEIKYG